MDDYLFLVDRSYCCVGPGLSCLPIVKKKNKIPSTFVCVYRILLTKKRSLLHPVIISCFCFADGRLVSCFGKSKLEVSSATLQCSEISARARDCTILKMI